MNLLSRIKEIAHQKGMSIKDVANKAGIGENSIYRWKTSQPSVASLNKVAKALDVSVDDLTSDPNNEETPEFRAIQRKAKKMTPEGQRRLLEMMKLAFDKDRGSDYND